MDGEKGKTLRELFEAAAGGKSEIMLDDGLKVEVSAYDNLTVDGLGLGELPASTVEAMARGLRRAIEDRYLDPKTNPLIPT
jgi:hypothetical protein